MLQTVCGRTFLDWVRYEQPIKYLTFKATLEVKHSKFALQAVVNEKKWPRLLKIIQPWLSEVFFCYFSLFWTRHLQDLKVRMIIEHFFSKKEWKYIYMQAKHDQNRLPKEWWAIALYSFQISDRRTFSDLIFFPWNRHFVITNRYATINIYSKVFTSIIAYLYMIWISRCDFMRFFKALLFYHCTPFFWQWKMNKVIHF